MFQARTAHKCYLGLKNGTLRLMSQQAQAKSKVEYYRLLDIPPNACLTEIREAYFRKAKLLHPDINPSEEAKVQFAQVQEAYQVLSNVDRRVGYDRIMKRDGVIVDVEAETKPEVEERLKRKKDDLRTYQEAKQEFHSGKVWTPLFERDTGPKDLKLNKEINRTTPKMKAEAEEKARNTKLALKHGALLQFFKKFDVLGGPKDDVVAASKHALKYVGVMVICAIIHMFINGPEEMPWLYFTPSDDKTTDNNSSS